MNRTGNATRLPGARIWLRYQTKQVLRIHPQSVKIVFLVLLVVGVALFSAAETNPSAAAAVLEGSIVGAVSRKPLAGAAIVLCKTTQRQRCVFQANLSAVANPDGSFRIENVPSGDYVVFYDPTGAARQTWSDIDGKEMNLDLARLTTPSTAKEDLNGTFGCGGSFTVKKGSQFWYGHDRLAAANGSVAFQKCGLTLEFRAGQPFRIQVQGKVSSVAINAWGGWLQVALGGWTRSIRKPCPSGALVVSAMDQVP